MNNDDRIIELLSEMVIKQDEMLDEMKQMNKRIEMNTVAISELRVSNMKLVDIIEKQVFQRLDKLEAAVFHT